MKILWSFFSLLILNTFYAQQFHFDKMITYSVENAKTKSISSTSYFVNSKTDAYYLTYSSNQYGTSANIYDLSKKLRYRFILNEKANRYDYDLTASLIKNSENSKYDIGAVQNSDGYNLTLTKSKSGKILQTIDIKTQPSTFPALWLFRNAAICCTKEILNFDQNSNTVVSAADISSKDEVCRWRLKNIKVSDITLDLPKKIYNKLKDVN